MGYDDGYDDEPDMNAFNEIMESKIIPRIDSVMEEIIAEGTPQEEVANELQKRLFSDEIKEELSNIGINMDDCEGIEMNVYTMQVDDKSELVDQITNAESHEDMAQIIGQAIDEKDRYPTQRSENGILSFNTYELKEPIDLDDVDPVSDDQLKQMFGESE